MNSKACSDHRQWFWLPRSSCTEARVHTLHDNLRSLRIDGFWWQAFRDYSHQALIILGTWNVSLGSFGGFYDVKRLKVMIKHWPDAQPSCAYPRPNPALNLNIERTNAVHDHSGSGKTNRQPSIASKLTLESCDPSLFTCSSDKVKARLEKGFGSGGSSSDDQRWRAQLLRQFCGSIASDEVKYDLAGSFGGSVKSYVGSVATVPWDSATERPSDPQDVCNQEQYVEGRDRFESFHLRFRLKGTL